MSQLSPQIVSVLETILFISVVFMHLIKKNSTAVALYVAQSTAVAALLVITSLERQSYLLLLAIVATVAVKLIIAPYFFFGLIKKHQLKFTASTYLNMPMTLLALATLTALTQTDFLKPLTTLASSGHNFLLISLATILISIFLIINRKGALSQMLGILSLENGIVSFALFAGLEQSPSLQLGITFNILIWIIIASVFISMIYRHFGTLDVTSMKELTE